MAPTVASRLVFLIYFAFLIYFVRFQTGLLPGQTGCLDGSLRERPHTEVRLLALWVPLQEYLAVGMVTREVLLLLILCPLDSEH